MEFSIEGLEVYGHHGVPAEERVLGQRLLFDALLTMEDCGGADTDDVTGTVDYTEVIDVITEVATVASYALLERLAQVTAEAVLTRFPLLDKVKIRVSKPQPPVACALANVAAAVELRRSDLKS